VTFNAPGSKGKATISVTASSGGSPAYTGSVSLLVYKSIFIIKCDDYDLTYWSAGSPPFYIRPSWKEYMDYMESEAMVKCCLMMICKPMETVGTIENGSQWITATQGYVDRGYIELACHGYEHENFTTFSSQEQLDLLTVSLDLSKSVLGITLYGFNAPGTASNADTVLALNQIDDMKYFYWAEPPGFNGLCLTQSETRLDAEHSSTMHIDYNMFLSNYSSKGSRPLNIVQCHPPWWQNNGPDYYDLTEWKKVINYLKSEGVTILHAYSDYYRMINDPAFIPDEGPGGSGGDTTPPGDISTVNDGTGSDVDSTSSTSQLSANWTPSTDGESGISDYKYAIGASPGSTGVVSWTSNGIARTVTKTGLTLTDGTRYYFTVKAVNVVGLESSSASSDGQVVVRQSEGDGDVKIYPNPYSPSKGNSMRFSIGGAAGGEVKIYTLSGKLVRELLIGAGENEVDWNVLNEDGNSITTGLYLYTITDGDGVKKTGKITITR
jgi:peptidoglycan/xylan/chitin deacetylase (PgdA/CDA1 family)